MAAPGKSEAMICDRCFASVKGGAEFCPECGAPLGSAPAEGSDAAIYPELARVNLLRMRGDGKAAIDQCRSILRKFPNNVTANQLLGDLCSESGDLEQAKEWYELALDIAPKHAQIQQKLTDVKQRLERNETQGLVEQLGLPKEKSRSGWIALGLAALVIAVGAVAYILGTKKPATNVSGAPKQTSFNAPTLTQPGGPQDESPATTPEVGTKPPAEFVEPNSAEELSLRNLLAQRSANGGKIMALASDPRTGALILTFRIEEGDDQRLVAAELATTALENSPSTRLVTLRGISGSSLAYMADVRRETYEETKQETWRQQNGIEASVIARHILSQEWPAGEPSEPAPQDPNATTGA